MQQGYQKPQVFFTFSGVETEIELILERSGILVKPVNFSEMTYYIDQALE